MDANTLIQIIGSLGFPIAACIAMFMRMEKQDERHQTEMASITEAINNNTNALIQLSAKLEV